MSTILITGATSGIGLEAAVALARQGNRLVLVGRNHRKTNAAVDEVKRIAGVVAAPDSAPGEARWISRLTIQAIGRDHLRRRPRCVGVARVEHGHRDAAVDRAALDADQILDAGLAIVHEAGDVGVRRPRRRVVLRVARIGAGDAERAVRRRGGLAGVGTVVSARTMTPSRLNTLNPVSVKTTA
jgi:NAD(P)-dependent dehydrogenase (short-subunit alcohol dehydrogenase family)